MVVARGATITAPVVACLTDGKGTPLRAPVRLDTHGKKHAVIAVVGDNKVGRPLPLDRMAVLAA